MNKKLLFGIIFGVILIGIGVFVLSSKNFATYDAEERTMTIKESIFSQSTLAEITLKSDLNVYVIRGKDRLVAEFEVDSLEKDYNTVFEKIDFYNVKGSMKKFERGFTYRYKQFYEEEVNDYETVCKEREVLNATSKVGDIEKYDCTENLIGSHTEERFNWMDLNDKEILPEGKLTIGVFTDVLPDEKVEWISTILGVRINQWAVWTESLNVDLWAYYTFNDTADDAQGDASRDGIVAGTEEYRSGKIGNAIYFNTTVGSYVAMLNPNFLAGDFAIAFWMNRTSSASNRIFGNNGSTYPNVGIGGYMPVDELQYHAGDGSGWIISSADLTSGSISDNNWHHLVIMRNSSGFYSYTDGAYVGTNSAAGTIDGSGQMAFGKHYDGEITMSGEFDEIGIWKGRDLTSAEITQLYNGGAGITYFRDIDPPSVIINSPGNATYNTPINFTATVTDATGVSDCWVTIDSEETNFSMFNTTSNPSAYNYSAPSVYSDGGYLAEFFCNDTIGNINDTETISFAVDTINPNINITYPINLSSFSFNTVDVNYTYSDTNIDSCWYSNGTYEFNTSLTSCGTNITTVVWADGKYNVTIWANDSAGNENSSRVTFTVDAVGPIVKLITPINNLNSSAIIDDFSFNMTFVITDWTNFTFYVWDSSHDEVKKRVVVNGTPDADCSASDESEDFIEFECVGQNIATNDNYEWNVYACKENGMCNFAASNFSFLVDTTAPTGVLDSPANNTITSTASQNFTVNITDNFGIKNATLNIYNSSGDLYNQTTEEFGEGILETTWGVVVTLSDDVYTWFYEIFDFAGNEDTTTNWTLSVDTINPDINITYPINNTNWSNANLDVNFTRSDANLFNCWYSNDTYISNTSLTTSCNNITDVIWIDGKHNVTIWANDTAGNINNSKISFTIDTTSPEVNVTAPIFVDYQLPGRNLTVNWTVLDPFLDSCWGSFDGGINNISLTCTDQNISRNITSVNNDTFTLWANDTFGHIGSTSRTWIYRIFEVQQTFSASTIPGSTETFVNNIFLGSGETITEVNFNYNGTDRSAGYSNLGGNEYNLSSTFIIPSVASATNITFFWRIDLVSGQINTSSKNQSIKVIAIDDCSAYSTLLFNYTIIGEESQSKLTVNTSLELDIDIFDVAQTILILNFSKKYTDTNPATVCLNINLTEGTDYSLDSTAKYSAANHSIEYYNIQNFLLQNATIPQHIKLYDLLTVDATEFQITFKDSNFVTVENALVQINRQYLSEGVFKTVEIPKTDSNGQTVAHLVEKDVVYNIVVLKEGEVLGTFNNIIAFCEDILIGSCFITLNALVRGEVAFDYDEEIGLFYDFDYNDTSRNLQFDFTTTDGSVKNVTLSAVKFDQLGDTSVCDGFLISSGGSIFCPVPISVGNESIIISVWVDGDLKITNYVQAGREFDIGDAGYFLMFFLVLSLALMMTQSKTGVIIGVILGFIAGVLLSFIQGGLLGIGSSVIWLIIMGVILIYKLNSQGQT